ncbi:MAG: SpoIID/LytB domain-containing protein [Myxococcales bacterium]|nr:SpoIID/LytB domain-containing protein [Myxococcales bacterium]
MLLTTLTLCLMTAEPLQVRVLERERPVTVTLTSERLRCDADPLPSPAELTVGVGEKGVAVKGRTCTVVSSTGVTTVTTGDVTRRYPGAMEVSLEGGALRLINTVDVEAYLPSVVQAELSGGPPAALEAQAVVSRTFALTGRNRHARAGYHLCDLTHCQWYRGLEADAPAAAAAVKKTKGQVLLVGGIGLKPAFFHSSCGGHTSTSSDIFHEAGAGPAIADATKDGAACKGAPDFAWTWEADRVELAKAVGSKPEGDAFVPLARDKAGRVLEVSVFGKRMDGAEFGSRIGRAFGWQTLKSLKVTASEVENTVTFKGTGMGHGVGLCQHGTLALAAKGWDAKKLLLRYFPDCQVRQVEE